MTGYGFGDAGGSTPLDPKLTELSYGKALAGGRYATDPPTALICSTRP